MMENKDETIVQEEVVEEIETATTDEETEVVSEEEVAEELTEVEQLQAELAELQEKLQQEENKYFRVLADLDNVKRRATLDKDALQKYKSQAVLTNVLPVLDNFERALKVDAETEEAKSMMDGMNMIYRSLVDALKSEGLSEIEAQDQAFDPNFHQAVMTGQEEDKDSGIVLEELQKGYMLKDRVLRPSMVKVND